MHRAESEFQALLAEEKILKDKIRKVAKELLQAKAANEDKAKALSFKIVRDFNWAIGPNVSEQDKLTLFSGEPVAHIMTADIFDILVKSGSFESKGQAKKNWKGIQTLPLGWTELESVGKQKVKICIWNPTD